MNCSINNLKIDLIKENEKLKAHYSYIMEWNSRMNIMSKAEVQKGYDHFILNHVYDALYAMSVENEWTNKEIIDVGSGAGLPGLTLAILLEGKQNSFTLCEATGKKAEFLMHVISKLALHSVTVINERAESIGHSPSFRERFDISTTRAVGYIDECLEYTIPLLKLKGRSLLMRGSISRHDVSLSTRVSNNLGAKLEKIVDYKIENMDNIRNIMVFNKYRDTPFLYPRKAGIPKKNSLFKGISTVSEKENKKI